jgi:hypothetical protein
MRIEFPDDADYEQVLKAWLLPMLERGDSLVKIAKTARLDRNTLRRWLNKWQWKKKWSVPDTPVAAPTPALGPQPSTESNPSKSPPSTLHPITSKGLDPELRARVEQIKARRKKKP